MSDTRKTMDEIFEELCQDFAHVNGAPRPSPTGGARVHQLWPVEERSAAPVHVMRVEEAEEAPQKREEGDEGDPEEPPTGATPEATEGASEGESGTDTSNRGPVDPEKLAAALALIEDG
ncbi:MAG: hypothetical protein AAF264_13360, partial [Pseudomonadota bacterium]